MQLSFCQKWMVLLYHRTQEYVRIYQMGNICNDFRVSSDFENEGCGVFRYKICGFWCVSREPLDCCPNYRIVGTNCEGIIYKLIST